MNRLKNEWKRYWDTRVKNNQPYFGMNKRNSDKIIQILAIDKKDRVLDIGCATGGHLSDIRNKTEAKCYGIDISPVPIKLNKDKKIKLKVASMLNMPYKPDVFTKIFALGTVEHSPETEEIFREINRVASIGGKIFITVPNKASFFHLTKNLKIFLGRWDLGYEKSFTKGEILRALNKTGFKLDKFWVEPHQSVANIFNFLDNFLNKVNNKRFGFFIYFTASKIKNV